MYGAMPRLEHATAHFYATLSQELKQEIVSPEQVKRLSTAIAQLPADARLTTSEIDTITRRMNLTAPHKATLVFALLLHRYPALKEQLKDQKILGNGLAGVLDALLAKSQQADGTAVAEALEKFFTAYAGPRAVVENSGIDLFKQTPPLITIDLKEELVQVRSQPIPSGAFVEGAEGGWAYRPQKTGDTQPEDVPIGRMSVQSMELLAQGISTYIGTRSQGQQNVKEADALLIARDVGLAGTLLREVIRLKDDKNRELLGERAARELELRTALGDYRVQRIGQETVNELVAAMFPQEQK
jgi:hypothetical protein